MTPSYHCPPRFQAKIIGSLRKSVRKLNKSPSVNVQTRSFILNTVFWENCFVKSPPHMAPQADPPEAKCSYIDPLSLTISSKTELYRWTHNLLPHSLISTLVVYENTFSFGAFSAIFREAHVAFCNRLDINLKYDTKRPPA